MKKFIIIFFSIAFVVTLAVVSIGHFSKDRVYTVDGVSFVAKTEDKAFLVYEEGSFSDTFLKGVNMGAAMPGTFPGELAISKTMYIEWFEWIYAMEADVIRVYTTLMPEFYDALYEFNQTKDTPLYIMQGVWLNENDAMALQNAFGDNRRLVNDFIQDAQDLVDIIHGNKTLKPRLGFASGEYTKDVSPYVIGWILGVEWDPNFVVGTNQNNANLTHYKGDYIYTSEHATPFEIFLTEVGDKVIEYEVNHYSFMRPLSFVNWPTTDPLNHPNEPDQREDAVSVTMKHIKSTELFHSGLFASYHVYPYYPEFMNYSLEYRNHIDHRDEKNSYQGYLKSLIKEYDIPVIVAEFGVPSSRGKTHDAKSSGFNQGFISEEEQGNMIVHMTEDIYMSGYAGGLLFTWQDEWFKRTWNTMDLDLAHRRPLWSNVQTNEQHFGLLAFDPGVDNRIRYVDGNLSDWEKSTVLAQNSEIKLWTAFDERYVYIRIDLKNYTFDESQIIIPISTTPKQGNNFIADKAITFTHQADFIIEIHDTQYAEIKVDAYYDPFYYMYHEDLKLLEINEENRLVNNGVFNPIYQALSNELFLPQEDRIIPFSKHHTGLLRHGNGNPTHKDYDSLADYFINDNAVEIKIPWQLLNISDPSSKMRLSDFYTYEGFYSESVEVIHIGAVILFEGSVVSNMNMAETTWSKWETPNYHMRLKQSYYIVKEAFSTYD